MLRRVPIVACVLLGALAGCTDSATAPAKLGPASGQIGFNVGDTAPDITGKDLDGTEFSLSDYRGQVVVLDFWGDW